MDDTEQANAYGRLCRDLVCIYRESGMPSVLVFIHAMERDDVDQILAHLIEHLAR